MRIYMSPRGGVCVCHVAHESYMSLEVKRPLTAEDNPLMRSIIYLRKSPLFFLCGTSLAFIYLQVMWCYVKCLI